ncbi:MAG: histidine kinase, partial [Methylomonas sp.]
MDRWKREIAIAALWIAVALVLGSIMGYRAEWLLAVTVVLLTRQSLAINELEQRLRHGIFRDYRSRRGIWGDIYWHLWKIKKSEKKRKKRFSKMIEQFRSSTDALPDAAVVLAEDGEIEWINRAAHEVLGLKKSDKGQRIPNLIRTPQFVDYLKSHDYQ